MNIYNTKKALVDLGFVNGYFYSRPSHITDNGWWETLTHCFENIEDVVIKGSVLEANPQEADYRRLLHDLGFIRGWAWLKEVPEAVSDALTRVVDYFSDALPVTEIVFAAPQAMTPCEGIATNADEVKGHDQIELDGPSTLDSHGKIKAEPPVCTLPAIENPVLEQASIPKADEAFLPEVPVTRSADAPLTKVPLSQKPRRGRQAKLQPSDLPTVRERIDAGFTLDDLAQKFGCSSQTVAKYLKAHGLATQRRAWGFPHEPVVDDLRSNEPTVPVAITTPVPMDFDPLEPDDWPDIQGLLTQGRSREAIASDYDVPVEYLNGYIADRLREGQERRAAKGSVLGEA